MTAPLSPFRWREDPRPSVFAEDAYFRAKPIKPTTKPHRMHGLTCAPEYKEPVDDSARTPPAL